MATNQDHNHPPKWANKLLEWYCREDLLEDLQGDLYEYYDRNLLRGRRIANLIFILDVLKFFRSYTFKKLKNKYKMNSYMLFKNYLKTSVRSLARNKLFSLINIIGLAISMSVGLVVITMLIEINHFDNFHEKGDQIYRVINTLQRADGELMNMASTSYFMSEQLKTSEDYQHMTTMINGFGGDANADGKKLVVSGLWASRDFFKVFTFPLLEGDPQTALIEPNSIILTQTTAEKLYGKAQAMGKLLKVDDIEYLVNGIVQDPPANSHFKFEALASLQTLVNLSRDNSNFGHSTSMWSTYIYMTIPSKANLTHLSETINQICEEENKKIHPQIITARLQPLSEIFNGPALGNQLGPTFPILAAVILSILPLIILLTACFNYTNLSIARSLRRTTEVGIRKVIGASRGHIFSQFVVESVIIALLALVISCLLFVPLREQFLIMTDGDGISLPVNGYVFLFFIGFAIFTGVLASLIPAATLSKFQALKVLRSKTSVKVFGGFTLRKVLLVLQFSISTLLILFTIVLNKQYNHAMNYDLGFSTEQILNVELQGNNPKIMSAAFTGIPEVTSISKSRLILHSNTLQGDYGKFNNPHDSTFILYNYIDENYINNHHFELLAGKNFQSRPDSAQGQFAIVNEKFLERFEMGDPHAAIGQNISIENEKLSIIGVIKDFNHSTLDAPIEPFSFRYNPSKAEYLNLVINTKDYVKTLDKLDKEWSKVDEFHPFTAKFYNDQIEETYVVLSIVIELVGFLALLAISIAAMGLLGMSVYAVETKIKEISIRKVMGASAFKLVYLLSKSYIWLLVIAALIAAPFAYFLINEIIMTKFAYFTPMSIWDILGGLLIVFFIGLVMISFQTYRAAQTNPANTLRNE